MENRRKRKVDEAKKLQELEKFAQEYCELEEKKPKLAESSSESNLTSSGSDAENEAFDISVDVSEASQPEEFSESEDEIVIDHPQVQEIKDIRAWVVDNNVPHQIVDKLLPILKARLLPEIPKCTKTLLKCNVNLDKIEPMEVSDGSMGEFIYFGIKTQLKKKVDVSQHPNDLLELIVNIDGFSPFKSSAVAVWPILGKVYTESDMYKPFTIAVYAGNGKPKSCEDYLMKFVKELNLILPSGVEIEKRHFTIKIKFFVCDCPARAFLKCIVGHCAFHGCERCRVIGQKVNKVTVFLQTDAEKRTDLSFARFVHLQHHTNDASPLCAVEPPINMISQFILDPMHLVYLGCTKRLLEYLLSASTHKVRLSGVLKSELVRRTQTIYKDISAEFPRRMRSSDQYAKYKAVEFKFFVLYAAPVVFKKLLSDNIYRHFMLLTVACRLLCNKNKNFKLVEARKYLKEFVDTAPTLYGETIMSLNMHNLIHLCDDVESSGCSLNEISAFSFESYLGSISSALRSPNHLVAQYCHRMIEKDTFSKNEASNPPEVQIIMKKMNSIVKLKYKSIILSTRHPNNMVLLQDKSIARICKFSIVNDNYYATIQRYDKKEQVFDDPCDSGTLDIWEISRISKIKVDIQLQQIKDKLIHFKLNFSQDQDTRSFVLPLLH